MKSAKCEEVRPRSFYENMHHCTRQFPEFHIEISGVIMLNSLTVTAVE